MALPTFYPTEDPSQAVYTASAYFRQNPWKTDTFDKEFVIQSKKLHLPFAHGHGATVENAPPQAQLGLSLKIGDVVVIAFRGSAVLALITSGVKKGWVEPLYLAIDPVEHYQKPAEYASGIRAVILKNSFTVSNPNMLDDQTIDGVKWAISKNYILEPFFGLYRDIVVLGEIAGVEDWRTLLGMASSGKRRTFFRLRQPPPRPNVIRSLTLGYVGEDDYPAPNV